MKNLLTICLLTFLLCASSCDSLNHLQKIKESSASGDTALPRTQLNQEWARIGESVFHRNGLLWIEFDSIISIDISPDYKIRVIGTNPVIHGYPAFFQNDSLKNEGDLILPEPAKPSKTKKIAPLLVLILLLSITLLWSSSKLKLY